MPTSTSRRPAEHTGRRLAAAVLVGTVGQLLVAVLLPGVARAEVRPRWALGLLVAGVGALLAVGWELAEW
jgi:hypothetical protein